MIRPKPPKRASTQSCRRIARTTHRKGWKWLLLGYSHPMFAVLGTWFLCFPFHCWTQNVEKSCDGSHPKLGNAGLPKYGATFEKEIWWGMSDASGQKCKMASICHPSVIHIHWFLCTPSTCMSPIYHSGCRSEWMTVFPQAPDTQMYEHVPALLHPKNPPISLPWPQLQGPKTAPRPKEKKSEETKSWGSQCHDFPLMLLIRFWIAETFLYVEYGFFQFTDSMLDYKFLWSQVLLEVRICRRIICTFILHSYGILFWLLKLQMSHVTRLFDIDKKITGCTVCVLVLCAIVSGSFDNVKLKQRKLTITTFAALSGSDVGRAETWDRKASNSLMISGEVEHHEVCRW